VGALWEYPAVAAWDCAELDHDSAAPALGVEVLVREVALKRDAVDALAGERERACRGTVGAVGPNEQLASDLFAVDAGAVLGDLGHARAVAELGAGAQCLL